MSRVLALSLTDKLYARVSEQSESVGMTVYQYVRKAVERVVSEDEHLTEFLTQFDDDPGE